MVTARQLSDAAVKARDGQRCAALHAAAHLLEARGDTEGLELLAQHLGIAGPILPRLAHPPCAGEQPLPGMEIGRDAA